MHNGHDGISDQKYEYLKLIFEKTSFQTDKNNILPLHLVVELITKHYCQFRGFDVSFILLNLTD